MKQIYALILFAVMVLPNPSLAAPSCSAALAKSVVARIDQVQATAGACKQVMQSNAPKATICSVCRATHSKLSSLRADYKANKTCLKGNPAVRAKALAYLGFKDDIKRLRKLCG